MQLFIVMIWSAFAVAGMIKKEGNRSRPCLSRLVVA